MTPSARRQGRLRRLPCTRQPDGRVRLRCELRVATARRMGQKAGSPNHGHRINRMGQSDLLGPLTEGHRVDRRPRGRGVRTLARISARLSPGLFFLGERTPNTVDEAAPSRKKLVASAKRWKSPAGESPCKPATQKLIDEYYPMTQAMNFVKR